MLGLFKKTMPHLTLAYNLRWRVSEGQGVGKADASYVTKREPLTDSFLADHFAGKAAISVQPLLDDGETCQWGAIDIDSYGDEGLTARVRRSLELFKIPCFVEQSKSKGTHVYIILDRPTMAKPFRRALKKLAIWIGHPKAEIRPAQDRINVSEGDLGSFMVLPGFNQGQDIAKALASCVVTIEQFNELTSEGDFVDGPPCLFPIQRTNESQGWSNRNLYLYQLAVFYRYKYPADWQDRIRSYNTEVVSPSLPGNEVEALITQLEKSTKCHYACKNEPFEPACNRNSCQMRRFGVAARDSFSGLVSPEGITVLDTDPPTWFVTLQHPVTQDTTRVKLTTAQLQSVAMFKKRCIEVLKLVPTLPKQAEWEVMVATLLESAEIVPVPFEMTEHARLLDLLYRYCLTSIKSTKPEDLLRGRVLITSAEDGFTARFRLVDFSNYLERYKYRGIASKDMYQALQELQRYGKAQMEKFSLPPLELDIWAVDIQSRYLELQAEIDLDAD